MVSMKALHALPALEPHYISQKNTIHTLLVSVSHLSIAPKELLAKAP